MRTLRDNFGHCNLKCFSLCHQYAPKMFRFCATFYDYGCECLQRYINSILVFKLIIEFTYKGVPIRGNLNFSSFIVYMVGKSWLENIYWCFCFSVKHFALQWMQHFHSVALKLRNSEFGIFCYKLTIFLKFDSWQHW